MVVPGTSQTRGNRQPLALIGTGPVGRSLGGALYRAGYPITSVIGLIPGQVAYLKRKLHADNSGHTVSYISNRTRVFILAVPDDQITPVAGDLAKLDFLDSSCTAVHCSGALPASIMSPLRTRQVQLLSFHPMVSFPRGSRRKSFRGISIGIEGDRSAIPLGFQMAQDIGAAPIDIPSKWKTTYHLSAVWGSNFLAGLLGQAISLMQELGHDRERSWEILEPLIEGTIEQIKRFGIERALTGPAHRGDNITIQRHIAYLSKHHPELIASYKEWTRTLITTWVRSLDDSHRRILDSLD